MIDNKPRTRKKKGINMSEVKFNIVQKIGVLSTSAKGWTKELNVIAWNDKEPKYDLREWSPDHKTMSRGVTLTEEEVEKLRELLNNPS